MPSLLDPASLRAWIRTPGLDAQVAADPQLARAFTDAPRTLAFAWAEGTAEDDPALEADRLIAQRALYELNRLLLYWWDDPDHYVNERSTVLGTLREALEAPWQRWLEGRVPREVPADADPRALVRAWMARDRTPTASPGQRWMAESMDRAGYRRLLEVTSLNGLVEASQLSRAVGGAPTPVQGTLFRILIEEYGGGRLTKKHSTFFAQMLEAEGLDTTPERYLDRAPWQVLAAINHAFHLAENKRHYLRFCGAFAYTEVSTPASFAGHAAAAQRLALSDGHRDYWSLHIREDTRHGAWMVEDVLMALFERFPERTGDVLFGYAQQREVERLAGAATLAACREASGGVTR